MTRYRRIPRLPKQMLYKTDQYKGAEVRFEPKTWEPIPEEQLTTKFSTFIYRRPVPAPKEVKSCQKQKQSKR